MSIATPQPTKLPPTPPVNKAARPQSPVPSADRAYWGDRYCLIFWFGCAGFLVFLHIGQHLVYLLRR